MERSGIGIPNIINARIVVTKRPAVRGLDPFPAGRQDAVQQVDASLLDSLGLKVGDTLLLGDTGLRVGRVITLEPDRGAGFMSFSPRVMLNQADVARTGLVQPASRVVCWREQA